MPTTYQGTDFLGSRQVNDEGRMHKWAVCVMTDRDGLNYNTALHWDEQDGALDHTSVTVCEGSEDNVVQGNDHAQRARVAGETGTERIISVVLGHVDYPQESAHDKVKSLSEAFISRMKNQGQEDGVSQMIDVEGIPAFLLATSECDAEQLRQSMSDFIKTQERLGNLLVTYVCDALRDDGCMSAETHKKAKLQLCQDPRRSDISKLSAIRPAYLGDPRPAFQALAMSVKDSERVRYLPWSAHEELKCGAKCDSDL